MRRGFGSSSSVGESTRFGSKKLSLSVHSSEKETTRSLFEPQTFTDCLSFLLLLPKFVNVCGSSQLFGGGGTKGGFRRQLISPMVNKILVEEAVALG